MAELIREGPMKKRWAASFAAAFVAAALVTGCGNSSSAAGGSAGGGTASAIPIGVVGSYSGSAASNLAVAKLAIQAWADSVNADGGINGHKVHLYIEDDGGSSQLGVTEVKSLVEQDHVVAIVGQAAASSAQAWAPYVQQKGIPVVGGVGVNLEYIQSPDFYASGGNLVSMLYGVGKLARGNGPDLGVLYCAELPACAANPTLFRALGSSLGLAVSFQLSVSASSPDYTAPCQEVKSSRVQSYYLGLASSTLTKLLPQCVQQGVSARLVLPDVLDSTFPAQAAFDGAQMASTTYPFFDESLPAAKQMHAAFAKYEPSMGTNAMPLNGNAVETFIAGRLFEAAVKASGSSTINPETVKKGLYALKDETLGGLAPPLTFTEGKPNLFNCFYAFSISSGKYVVGNDAKPTCVSDAVLAPIIAKLAG
jgi:branched-chain amino acid transport system substrate-binding protein